MESSLASGQFEKFSTAELSPPISPAPQSPSLYNHGSLSPNYAVFGKEVLKTGGNEFLGSNKTDAATNFPLDLAHFNSSQYKSENDLGFNWNEESVNLELFSELSELVYASPATPVSDEFTNQHSLSQFSDTENTSSLSTNPLEQSEFSPEIYDQLSAEFQAILESLPGNTGLSNYQEFDDLIAISGIPVHEDNDITNTSNYAEVITPNNNDNILMEVDLTAEDYSGIICLHENNDFQNGNIFHIPTGNTSNIYPTIDISDEILQENSDVDESILDALLLGNLSQAQSILSNLQTKPISNAATMCTNTIDFPPTSVPVAIPSTSGKQNKAKSGGRRAKTTESTRRDGLSRILDKSLRKKEQNKTAANRYRLKKKMETVVTSEVELTMQNENDKLDAESKDLARQISIVKQLLRDIKDAKKKSNLKRKGF